MSNYAYVTATGNIKGAPSKIKGIFVSAASSTPTLTIYDSQTTGTGATVLATFTPTAASNYHFQDGINVANGLYVVVGGTVGATIYYE